MNNEDGTKLQGKMVDFAICIEPDSRFEKNIRNSLKRFPAGTQSVNQTMIEPLRRRPIAISLETKLPYTGGATGDVQLATWAGAGLVRTRQLLQANDCGDEPIPPMPTLSMHGHDLHMQVFQDELDEVVSSGPS